MEDHSSSRSSPASALYERAIEGGIVETIVAAAHLYRPATWRTNDPRAVSVTISASPPARHHNLFWLVDGEAPTESGFMTSLGRFVGREEALRVALASGQPMIDHPARHATLLFSEDLW